MISDLLAARLQMAVSLGFHIVFASIGVAMPFLMAVAHWNYLKSGKQVYLDLTKAWSKGVAIFFATGAVSGTVLSFELGLLFPKFMEHAGPIIGMPFSWEGTAFFLEAIALGLFLYGWNKMPRWAHWVSGLVVGISGVLSALFVICANAWMNSPTGFDWVNGEAKNIDPWAAMFNDAALGQGIHMVIAAFAATGFGVASVHAFGLLRNKKSEFHRAALTIAMSFAAVAALIQPISGDLLAKDIAKRQPVKLAAMESLFETTTGAPLLIGGIPDSSRKTVHYAIHIPKVLSFLATGNFNGEVKGLNTVSPDEWPPLAIVHWSFQVMVMLGSIMVITSAIWAFLFLRKNSLALSDHKLLKAIVLCGPIGFIAIEAGWIVTEVGRQPWIIYNIMRTAEAVTPIPGIVYSMFLFFILYVFLSAILFYLMRNLFRAYA